MGFFKVYIYKSKKCFFAATCWTGGNRGMGFFMVYIYKSKKKIVLRRHVGRVVIAGWVFLRYIYINRKKYFFSATCWTVGNRGMGVF
jgi:uncharacterized membrane protein